jgi:hypothetical protein
MKKYLKNILYGFLAWLIPFAASFFFYTREGKLTIDIFLFKSIMIVLGSFSAAFLLVSYFKKINADYFKEGIIVGLTWFGINILLDLLILIPMSGRNVDSGLFYPYRNKLSGNSRDEHCCWHRFGK